MDGRDGQGRRPATATTSTRGRRRRGSIVTAPRGSSSAAAAGSHNSLKLGVAYDTRDFEPDPNSGVFVELTGELRKYTLSDYDWARVTFSPRAYYSPFPKLTDLVVAGRARRLGAERGHAVLRDERALVRGLQPHRPRRSAHACVGSTRIASSATSSRSRTSSSAGPSTIST